MMLDDDHMATVLATIRSIPDSEQDRAWDYIGEWLRCHPWLTDDGLGSACRAALKLYGRSIAYHPQRDRRVAA